MPISRRAKSAPFLLLLIALIAAAVYLPKLMTVGVLDHDDAISMIAATCNQGRYELTKPSGQWSTAADWQQFWQMRGFGCFGTIADDLVHFDIHPPLYFWLLHIWMTIFGVTITGALLLNLVLLAVIAVVIFTTCRLLAVSKPVSFVVTLGWTLSLPSRSAIGVIRQYTLLTLMAAVLLLLLVLWLKTNQNRYLIGLGVLLTAGFLTHYHFIIPAALGSAFAAAVQYRRGHRRLAVHLAAAFGAAVGAFLLIHPHFGESFATSRGLVQPFTFPTFVQRIVAGAGSILQIFDPLDWSYPLPYGLVAWNSPLFVVLNIANMAVGAILAYFVIRLALRASRNWSRGELSTEQLPMFTAVTTWLAVMTLYVMHVSPVHAIGLQYVHFVTPFIYVALAQGLEKVSSSIPKKTFAAAPVVLVLCGLVATTVFVSHKQERQRIEAVANADTLLIDSDKIGVLPPVVLHAKPTTKVYAAMQDEMLARFPDLVPQRDGKLYFVTSYAYGNTTENRDRELSRITGYGFGNPVQQPGSVMFLIHLGGDLYTFPR